MTGLLAMITRVNTRLVTLLGEVSHCFATGDGGAYSEIPSTDTLQKEL